jgi:hypothetical protein
VSSDSVFAAYWRGAEPRAFILKKEFLSTAPLNGVDPVRGLELCTITGTTFPEPVEGTQRTRP